MKEPKTSWSEDLKILRQEYIDLKAENRRLKDSNIQTNNQLRVRDQEVTDLKKTISKMKQEHEAEIRELGDELMEAKAEANAMRNRKDQILEDRARYADALDNDSIAFEEILSLAILMERGAKSMHEVSRMIQAKTEGRV